MVEQPTKNSKGLYLGVAAAAAVVGAALLYHFVFAGDDEEGGADSQIMQELADAGLDTVKKTPDGQMLDPKYMLQLLNFVT